jgi:lipoprotein NlpI
MARDQRTEALASLNGLLQQYPDETFAYYQRGCLRCWLGDFTGSVADFDQYVKLRPEFEQRFWERGISYYFTAQYAEGAKQFELYQSYHDNDVENSVWRYLCQAKIEGHEAAQKQLLPIKNDPRVPLMDIYRLFRGEAQPEDVVAAIEAGDPTPSERQSRQFYGHYYLALYHDAHDRRTEAMQHIKTALEVPAQAPRISRYMWDVAKVHAQTWEKEQ